MKYKLNLNTEGRILSATYEKYDLKNSISVEKLPIGNITDYLYTNGDFIYNPLPEIEENEPQPTEIEKLRADIDFIAIMTGVEL